MQKAVKGLLCALALVCAFGLGRGDNSYTENDLALAREEAYNSGYHTGYDQGLTAQQQALYEKAFAAGQADGYQSGYDAGLTDGHAQTVPQETQTLAALPSMAGDSMEQPAEVTVPEETAKITVYITDSGTKYHLEGCRHLKSKTEKTLEEAKALNREPCKVCNPPK